MTRMRRIENIEVLRAVSVLMVLMQHLPVLSPAALVWWFTGPFVHFNFGAGVNVFFCISGFVVTRALLPELTNIPRMAALVRVGRFWIRRAFRLWPTAWLWLFVAYALSIVFNRSHVMSVEANAANILPGIFMYANYSAIGRLMHRLSIGTMGQYWSLSLEEQIYAVLPLLLVFASRAALPLLITLLALWWSAPVPILFGIFFRPDCFLAGAILAFVEGGAAWRWLERRAILRHAGLRLLACLCLAAAAAWWAATNFTDAIFGIRLFRIEPFLTPLVCALLVGGAAISETSSPAGFFKRILTRLGARSYVIYVVHPIAAVVAIEVVFRLRHELHGAMANEMVLTGTAFLVLVVATQATALLVEQPLRRFGRRRTP